MTIATAAEVEALDVLKQSIVQLCCMRPLRQSSRCGEVDRPMPMKIQVQCNAAHEKQADKKEKTQKCDHGGSDLFLVGTRGVLPLRMQILCGPLTSVPLMIPLVSTPAPVRLCQNCATGLPVQN
jgi:hypothetical protein